MKTRKWKREVKPEYDREVHAVLNKLHTLSAYRISKLTFVSASTVSKLRRGYKYGGTRYPTHVVMARLAKLAGYRYELVPMQKEKERPTERPDRSLHA